MAICVHVIPEAMNAGQYKQAVRLIAEAGQAKPAGRLYHVTFGTGNKLQVFDIWKSQHEWDDFSPLVAKASQEAGVEGSIRIEIEPVVDIITP